MGNNALFLTEKCLLISRRNGRYRKSLFYNLQCNNSQQESSVNAKIIGWVSWCDDMGGRNTQLHLCGALNENADSKRGQICGDRNLTMEGEHKLQYIHMPYC